MEHEQESAGRIDERNAAVQREMQIAIALVSSRAQLPERPALAARCRVLGESAPFSGCEMRIDEPVNRIDAGR
jgi:hypothetical protein